MTLTEEIGAKIKYCRKKRGLKIAELAALLHKTDTNADVVLVDLDKEYTVDAAKFHSVVKHSPFNGFAVKGAPVLTIVRGTVVAENGEVVGQPGHGKMVRPIK